MRGNSETMPAAVRDSTRRSYRDTVRSVDDFLAQLRADSAADDPAIVVHSDHGESFGDHGNYGHHHREVYEENVHVPFLAWNAGVRGGSADPVSLASVPSLALSIADRGTFTPDDLTRDRVHTASECGSNQAVRERRFKYLVREGSGALFDLERDPGEQADVSASNPDRTRELAQRLDRSARHTREREAITVANRRIAAGIDAEGRP